jgi:hypothetical protein
MTPLPSHKDLPHESRNFYVKLSISERVPF